MADTDTLPAVTEADLKSSGLPSLMKMSPGLALFFNDAVYARCKAIAGHMSKAEGMTPRHLIGKPEACFAVISRSITWNLDPQAVAMATYQTPGGSIGYMGVLVQAILEASGAFDGGITFKHEGDWSKVQGKFTIKESQKGGKYVVPSWGPEDAVGLSVTVSGKMKGEVEPRTLKFELNEAFPLNSPLWATAPNRQICYTAVRAFGNLCTPSILMGVPFDVDPSGFYAGTDMETVGASTTVPARPTREKENAFNREEAKPPAAESAPAADKPHQQDTQAAGAGEESQEQPHDESVETPLARGKRLLALVKTVNDLADLRLTITEELLGDDSDANQKIWDAACDARGKELTPNIKMDKK